MADISNPPSNDATVQRNGRPATAEALGPLAFAGYAHFTALQVRGGKGCSSSALACSFTGHVRLCLER